MDITIKIIGAVGGIFALYKILIEIFLAKSSRRREEYDFSKKYLKDLYDDKVHIYVKEKGFLALTGQMRSVLEIKHLLEKRSPHEAIEQLALCGKEIFSFDSKLGKYCWSEKLNSKVTRKRKKWGYLALYVIFALLCFDQFFTHGIKFQSVITQVIYSISFLIIAIASLIKHENLKESEKFFELINK